MSEMVNETGSTSPGDYCRLATRPVTGNGYSQLPQELLQAEQEFNRADKSAAAAINRGLCQALLDAFILKDSAWVMPDVFRSLYQVQLERIEANLHGKSAAYFSLTHDPFLKDLAILRHRLIPFGAELATPYSGVSRRLLLKGGWRQVQTFTRTIMDCGGLAPLLEMHMHPDCTRTFTPSGWLDTYDNLADFLALNPVLRGVHSTSWFLDPAIRRISPHLGYLRQIPERCGATFYYAGADNPRTSGAFATSGSRREMHARGLYTPRLYTRIWPRQALLQRQWRQL